MKFSITTRNTGYQASTDDFEKENRENGDEISSSLASAAKVIWHKTVKQEALKLKLDKASTPVNCAFLLPKRTNTEVWKNLPSYVRTGDVKLQEVQKQQAAPVVMILRAASELTEASKQPGGNNPQVKEVMNALKEAMILSGSTCQLINQFGRDQMKPSISKEFKKLATDNDESSDFLFGSSVCDRLETLKKENKLAALLDKEKDKKRKRYKPTETRSSNYRPSYKSQKRVSTRARNQKSQTGNVEMCLRLTPAKEIAISELCSKILNAHKVSIRTLAQLLGKFSISFMAVPFGKLHYRALERFKTQSLKIHKGKFDRKVSLNPEARLDILWWRDNIKGSWSPIIRNNGYCENN